MRTKGMVISLSSMASHLQLQIIQKAESGDYINLQESSSHGNYISNQVKRRIEHKVDAMRAESINEMPVFQPPPKIPQNDWQCKEPIIWFSPCSNLPQLNLRLKMKRLDIKEDLTDDYAEKLINLLVDTQSTASHLLIDCDVSCKPETFTQLLKICKTTSLSTTFDRQLYPSYMRSDEIQNLDNIGVQSILTGEDILKLKARTMCLTRIDVTLEDFNKLLKQWYSGKRDIVDLNLIRSRAMPSPNIRDIVFADLPVEKKTITYTADWDESHTTTETRYYLQREGEKVQIEVYFSHMKVHLMSSINKW